MSQTSLRGRLCVCFWRMMKDAIADIYDGLRMNPIKALFRLVDRFSTPMRGAFVALMAFCQTEILV
jgi:hypothetical protein